MELIDILISKGYLKTQRIIKAFKKIKRADFLPEDLKKISQLNEALPIGFGQTISQPLVVAFMLEKLDPQPGNKILDIGSGSGWTSALLAEIVGEKGKVIAIEVIPELKERGEKNVAKYNFIKKGIVKFVCLDGSKGYKREAPFDKILCSAAIQEALPLAWKEQLKIGGKIVTPIGFSVWEFEKKSETRAVAKREDKRSSSTHLHSKEYPGFAFVPLITEK